MPSSYATPAAMPGGRSNTLIIGGGPAGLGPLIAARRKNLLPRWLALGVTLIEQGGDIGAGEIGRYAIRSDSHADSFLAPLAIAAQPDLEAVLGTAAGRQLQARRGGPVELALVAEFLAELGAELRSSLAGRDGDPFLTGLTARRATRQRDGSWLTDCRLADGSGRLIASGALVLATGAEQRALADSAEQVAGVPFLPQLAGKSMLSGEFLGRGGVGRARLRLRGIARPRVVVVGGAHSAMSSALLALEGLEAAEVTVLHRRDFCLTYQTPREALADGYAAFGADDICPRSGRVFPLAGLRSDARQLLRRHWRLGGCGPEPRLRLLKLDGARSADAVRRALGQADLVIAALGYRPRALPLYDESGARIALQADDGRAALVDRHSRVLDAHGAPLHGVYALGLAAGYPLAGSYGEPSFAGQANGLSLWHGDIGEAIVEQILEHGARAAASARQAA